MSEALSGHRRGGLFFRSQISDSTDIELREQALGIGMLTILNPAPVSQEPVGVLECIDIIIPNELEAKVLAGCDVRQDVAPLQLAKAIKTKYEVGCVIITLGNKGSMAYDGTERWQVRQLNVPVVDTTGAGDAYIGAFAYAYDRGMDMQASMEWANYVAALSVTRSGSILSFPTLAEVEEFINNQQYA